MKFKHFLFFTICLVNSAETCWSQFKSTLSEGDYTPVKSHIIVDNINQKYKDQPHVYFDAQRNLWHATWTQFDHYKSKLKKDISVIYYAQSIEGKAWMSAKQLSYVKGDCLDSDSTVKGPMPCVGLNGEIYVSWASPKGLAFQRSLDSGKTWLKEEKIINAIPKGWASTVDGIHTNGLPVIACDLSKGEFKGRIYISWSDEKNGEKNKDVFLVYSDDKGENWTEPILVTYHPNHKEQFKPSIKVDSLTGFVYILYFDKQNYLEGRDTDLTLAISQNGGLKFDYYKVNEVSFPFNSNHTALTADTVVRATWVQVNAAKRFALYEVILNEENIQQYYANELDKDIKLERSFVFQDRITIAYELPKNALLSVAITKPLEPGFEKVIFKNKHVFAGKNSFILDLKALRLKKGSYIVSYYYNGRNSFSWITEE